MKVEQLSRYYMAQSLAKIRDAEYSIRSGTNCVPLIYCHEAIEFMIKALLTAYNIAISEDRSVESSLIENEKVFHEHLKKHVRELVESLRDIKTLEEKDVTGNVVNNVILLVNRLYELISSHINSLNMK